MYYKRHLQTTCLTITSSHTHGEGATPTDWQWAGTRKAFGWKGYIEVAVSVYTFHICIQNQETGSGILMCTNKNLTVKCASGQNSGNVFFDTSNPVWCLGTTLCSLTGTKVWSFIIQTCKSIWTADIIELPCVCKFPRWIFFFCGDT